MRINGETIGLFMKSQRWRSEKCLDPQLCCENKAIKAHSIQNSRVIDLLAVDGHVISPRPDVSQSGLTAIFRKIGRNTASTFTGLCAEHDSNIFRPLDTQEFDPRNHEQLFLLAYRSVTRELHAVLEGYGRIQSAESFSENQFTKTDGPTQNDLVVALSYLKLNEAFEYRSENFDKPLLEKKFTAINHDIIFLNDQTPAIAVSSLFSFANLKRGDDLVRCVLNIFPLSKNRTIAVFSYTRRDTRAARNALRNIFSTTGNFQKLEISKLILDRIENFIISPALFDTWTPSKAEKIKRAFMATLFTDVPLADDSDLMLF